MGLFYKMASCPSLKITPKIKKCKEQSQICLVSIIIWVIYTRLGVATCSARVLKSIVNPAASYKIRIEHTTKHIKESENLYNIQPHLDDTQKKSLNEQTILDNSLKVSNATPPLEPARIPRTRVGRLYQFGGIC